MNFVPILTRELRCGKYRLAAYRQRFGMGAATGVGLLALVLLDRWSGGVSLARLVVFPPLIGIVPFMLFILGLHGAGTLLSAERREGTLPLLTITRLSGWDIILGKLLQALLEQVSIFLAAVPALVLPIMALGFGLGESSSLTLESLNLLFFSQALGLVGAVFVATRVSSSWSLFFFPSIHVCSAAVSLFLPGGALRDWLIALQLLSPWVAVAHALAAAVGFRPGVFCVSL